MKRLKVLLISIFCIIICLITVFADYTSDVVVSLQINNPIMQVNGEETEIDIGKGTHPLIVNSRTLVPIRAIIEAFGGTVEWEESTKTVLLELENDEIKLVINSTEAYLNSKKETLDIAPTIINSRTMLPIRFIAEGFNLGVAWNGETKTVSIIRNKFDENEYDVLMNSVTEYSGDPFIEINNNIPLFKDFEIIDASFEYYSTLDEFGRCDVCFASITTDLMPTEPRKSISSITPTGWINVSYDNVDGGYLYNRCHLIGFQLTGENANQRNLITGTRYMNIEGMLPFENEIADYIEQTGNRVIYRSTPVFTENNLVADGVLLEAYSVEDDGQGISFCVYCYNVQPEIEIDYRTGESNSSNENDIYQTQDLPLKDNMQILKVYRTLSGRRYHFDAECGGKNSFETTLSDAENAGLTPCLKCAIENIDE